MTSSTRLLVSPRSELGRAQRHALVGLIVGLHVLLLWALLQVRAVSQAVLEAPPIFVSLVPREAPPPPPALPTPRPAPPPRLIVARPTPAAAPATTFVVEPRSEEPPPVPAATAVVQAPPPAPPAPPPPKLIPASGVQYLVAPPLEYPRASRRMGEAGRVLVRVHIDEDGLPRHVQVSQSSGHARLDEAAVAAVHKARFRPYTENGRAVAGWAFIPLSFDLER